jgi:hypothetical protein
MLASYDDIRDRIPDPPLWYDENGVPRYESHHPKFCPNIYADEVILLEIECQACHERFMVQMCSGRWRFRDGTLAWVTFKPDGCLRAPHYGDPPRHDRCAGDTMNCDDLRVVEFWERWPDEWQRVPELERPISYQSLDSPY